MVTPTPPPALSSRVGGGGSEVTPDKQRVPWRAGTVYMNLTLMYVHFVAGTWQYALSRAGRQLPKVLEV